MFLGSYLLSHAKDKTSEGLVAPPEAVKGDPCVPTSTLALLGAPSVIHPLSQRQL